MFKIGFHTGSGGNPTGIGDYFRRLDAAGIPAAIMSSDNAGPVFELQQLAKVSGVNHVMAWRDSVHGLDVPKYHLTPAQAALIHWQSFRAYWPPELDKSLVWAAPVNEVDMNHADWLGWFACEYAELTMAAGFKIAMFGWSAGEPEAEHWQTPGMLAYLQMCEAYPDQCAIALHEYSYNHDSLRDSQPHPYPYQIGRFRQLHNVCDVEGISRPTLLITEFGWGRDGLPEPQNAMPQLDWAAKEYEPYDNIIGANIWYLGPGFGSIANKAQKLIAPVTEMALNWQDSQPPDPPISPQPPVTHVQLKRDGNVRIMPETGGGTLIGKGSTPAGTTFQFVEYVTGQAPSSSTNDQWAKVYAYIWTGLTQEVTPPGFTLEEWPTDSTIITQYFGANPAVYGQYGLPGHDGVDIAAAIGDPVYASADGRVYRVHLLDQNGWHNYGNHVRIEHGDDGEYKTIYAHLSEVVTEQDSLVTAGDVIGYAGNSGNSTGPHLHFGMKHAPGDPGWPYDLINPWPYLQPLIGAQPPAQHDLAKYFLPTGDRGQIYIMANNWGQGDERVQLHREVENTYPISYVVKNSQWEKRRIGNQYIDLLMDTSPGDGKYYTVQGHWLPRFMSEGDTFTRHEIVNWYHKADCTPTGASAEYTNQIRFIKRYPTWTHNGITLADVAEFEWIVAGHTEEVYSFAANLGLVRWRNAGGRESGIVELIPPGSQQDNEREVIICL